MKSLIMYVMSFFLDFFCISLNDFVAYVKKQKLTKTRLPLEILYENDYRYFFFKPLKKPVAIICGNLGVAFEDAPQMMNWCDANKYCELYSAGGRKWSLQNKEAGRLQSLYEYKDVINVVLKAFDKEPLKEDNLYWTAETSLYCDAYVLYLNDGCLSGCGRHCNGYVRPITIL